jgi:hypothetical protein
MCSLWGNSISEEGARTFAEMLQGNTTLEELK